MKMEQCGGWGLEVPAQLTVAKWKGRVAFSICGLHQGPGHLWLTFCRPVKGSGDEGLRASKAPSGFGLFVCCLPACLFLMIRTQPLISRSYALPGWLCY